MNDSYISLGPINILIAAGFVMLAGLISVFFQLGLLKKLAVGMARTALQLLLAGAALATVFGLQHIGLVLLLGLVMTLLAGREVMARLKVKLKGAGMDALLTMTITSFVVAVMVTGVVIGAKPFWKPSVFIPLLGMILGNSLNGISLSLDSFLTTCAKQRHRIEARLALGASPNEALQPIVREAIRTGMIPMTNAMAIVGIVSLPGMMTGQLIAGADPMDAVMYQIVVMYMLAAAVALGSSGVVLLARKRVMNRDMTLRQELTGY